MVDYAAVRFEDVVSDVDVVYDTVGGDVTERSWGVLKPGGILVVIAGMPDTATAERAQGAHLRDERAGGDEPDPAGAGPRWPRPATCARRWGRRSRSRTPPARTRSARPATAAAGSC